MSDLYKLDLAQAVARYALRDCKRKDYTTTFEHTQRVVSEVWHLGPHAAVVAWLHDVIEDSKIKASTISDLFGHDVTLDVMYLTNKPERTYQTYIRTLCYGGPTSALHVKLADLKDNLNGAERYGLSERYLWARERIQDELIVRHQAAVLEEAGVRMSAFDEVSG